MHKNQTVFHILENREGSHFSCGEEFLKVVIETVFPRNEIEMIPPSGDSSKAGRLSFLGGINNHWFFKRTGFLSGLKVG